jgi:hypothetical protein
LMPLLRTVCFLTIHPSFLILKPAPPALLFH